MWSYKLDFLNNLYKITFNELKRPLKKDENSLFIIKNNKR
jgi:hypothetical protein